MSRPISNMAQSKSVESQIHRSSFLNENIRPLSPMPMPMSQTMNQQGHIFIGQQRQANIPQINIGPQPIIQHKNGISIMAKNGQKQQE